MSFNHAKLRQLTRPAKVSISKVSRGREQRQQPSSHGDSKGSRGDAAGTNSGGAAKVNAIQFGRQSPARTATAGPRLLARPTTRDMDTPPTGHFAEISAADTLPGSSHQHMG